VRTGLIVTDAAYRTLQAETDLSPEQLRAMADECFDNADIGAGPASGSWQHDGMMVVPASMKTVAGIVSGYSDSLLLRAADVTPERRPGVVRGGVPWHVHLRISMN
jgi:4-hydroxy-3-polyprenylbenzoate decarboxylase